jgi:WD40 repeat protein
MKFESFTDAFHHGSILSLDLCIRKPLLVTCSSDKSIKVWNYVTGVCEMTKYFGEDAYSVAMHPSGLYILVGFIDKLRLMNILMNDLGLVKEFSVRACREVLIFLTVVSVLPWWSCVCSRKWKCCTDIFNMDIRSDR